MNVGAVKALALNTMVANWHFAAFAATHHFVAYWVHSGQTRALGLNKYAAIDPTATLAVHYGNGFDACFSPYRSARLNRYNAVS